MMTIGVQAADGEVVAAAADSPEAAEYREEEAQVEAGKPRSLVPSEFFSPEEQQTIIDCIRNAERTTTAEIRLRVERKCEGDPLLRCRILLDQLGITQTQNRTGMIIYLSIEDHQVGIFGDQAVHELIGDEGWQLACKELQRRFTAGDFVPGICETIQTFGATFSRHFPSKAENPNELPDEPSFEK